MSNSLIGKTVKSIKIADDKKAILFDTGSESIVLKADGDCCSSSWFEHIEMPFKGLPAAVISVEEIELPAVVQTDELQAYGCKIVTDKGDIVIDMRNESNGYYGGNFHWPEDECFYGGVHGQNISTENWVDFKELA